MDLTSLVNEHFDELQQSDRIILKQIIANQQAYQFKSSEEIANDCHVSRATLLRLCRKIGLQSFSDLKYLLRSQKVNKEEQTTFTSVCESYHLLIQELQKVSYAPICERIYKAETIYVYGTGNEQKNLAEELKRIFLSFGKCVIDLFDEGEVLLSEQNFMKDDLFIMISLSGESKDGIAIMKHVQHQLHTVSLTRLQNNTISSLCEYNLYVATQQLSGIQYTNYELVGVFYALLDVLFVHYMKDYHATLLGRGCL